MVYGWFFIAFHFRLISCLLRTTATLDDLLVDSVGSEEYCINSTSTFLLPEKERLYFALAFDVGVKVNVF